jgi:hypothetical protein
MKQYRITSANYVLPGETGDTDAVMDSQDLYQIKKLAGLVTEGEGGAISGIAATPRASEDGIQSPVGSNISHTADYRNRLLDKYHAKPGDQLWFLINFEPVRGLSGNIDHLEQKIQAYLKQHPEKRPENLPKPPGD